MQALRTLSRNDVACTEFPGRHPVAVLYHQYQRQKREYAVEDLLSKKIMFVEEGFYWVKYRPGSRWEPAEFDGVVWDIGDGSGYDLYLVADKLKEPAH